MPSIALCICTYDRPQGLRALLGATDKQRLPRLADDEVHIVIVDNSRMGSAEAVFAEYTRGGRFKTSFVHEPRKGLARARNAALSAARELRVSYVAFIDDDEVPDPSWLEELVGALERSGVAAAIGPVYPLFETQPRRWVPSQAYATNREARKGFVSDGYTGNSIIKMSTIAAYGLRFDDRFNETGGEDTILFRRLRDHGENITKADRAVVLEIVPLHRMTPGWLWRRWYRTGIIEAHLGKYNATSARGRAINLAKGIVRLVAGSVHIAGTALLQGWRKPDAAVASFYTACRGAGLVAMALGISFKEHRAQHTGGRS